MPLRTMEFAAYPGYTGNLAVTGTVAIGSVHHSGTQVLFFDLAGTDPACTSGVQSATQNGCGIHVHEGMSCDAAGGHYYNSDTLTTDPWLAIVYKTVGGAAVGQNVHVTTGVTLADTNGRTFVVHDVDGGRVACASLAEVSETGTAVVPPLVKYPGYQGALMVQGTVHIAQEGTGTSAAQIVRFDLTGVDPACLPTADFSVANACGVHIHAGTTCDDASQVGGHYWDSQAISQDPWAKIQYIADGTTATGVTTPVVTGLALSEVVGHAFVVHDVTGGRVACALIEPQVASGTSGHSPQWWALLATAALAPTAM